MTTDYASYGVSNEMSTANLLTAIAVYKEMVKKLAGTTTPVNEIEKKVTEMIRSKPLADGTDLLVEVRETVLSTLFRNPDLSVKVYDGLKDLLVDVKNLRDYHVSTLAKNVKVELPARTSSDAIRDDATGIRNFISSAFKFLSGQDDSWPGFNAEELAQVPTKNGKDGKLLDLPQVPGTKNKGTGTAGRGVAYRIARYTISRDGETISVPAGTHLRDVLISYCSNSVNGVVTVSKVQEMLKVKGMEIAAKPGHTWNVLFTDGTALASIIPTDADTSVSDDDEEDEENEEEENE